MSEPTIFDRGDLVWVRLPSREWMRGIVTDCFRAPITGREVVVVNGTGYYADEDVVPHHEPEPSEPQSLRAPEATGTLNMVTGEVKMDGPA